MIETAETARKRTKEVLKPYDGKVLKWIQNYIGKLISNKIDAGDSRASFVLKDMLVIANSKVPYEGGTVESLISKKAIVTIFSVIVPELKEKGYRIGVVDSYTDFDIDWSEH